MQDQTIRSDMLRWALVGTRWKTDIKEKLARREDGENILQSGQSHGDGRGRHMAWQAGHYCRLVTNGAGYHPGHGRHIPGERPSDGTQTSLAGPETVQHNGAGSSRELCRYVSWLTSVPSGRQTVMHDGHWRRVRRATSI